MNLCTYTQLHAPILQFSRIAKNRLILDENHTFRFHKMLKTLKILHLTCCFAIFIKKVSLG
jgi:hypothetical protein